MTNLVRIAVLGLLVLASPALSDAPDVVAVSLQPQGAQWRVDVTLAHPDSGWDHYADGWRVETEDGTVLGTRDLLHPHETEQPFTRSLAGVSIPANTARVMIRARCNIDGWASETTLVALPD